MSETDVIFNHRSGEAHADREVLARLDGVRADVEAIVDDRRHWRTEARREAGRAADLASQLQSLQAAFDGYCREAEERERRATEEQARMRETQLGLERQIVALRDEVATLREQADAERRRSRWLREKLQELHALYEARRFDDSDTLYEQILDVSTELVGAEKGAYLRHVNGHAILATRNFDDVYENERVLKAVAERITREEHHEPIVLNEQTEIDALVDGDSQTSLRCLIGYPIIIKDRLAGIVIVANKDAGTFSEEDSQILLGVGGHAAVAIENRRLRRDIEDAYASTVALLWNVIEAKDPYTRGHCEEVASLAVAVARELGLELEQQELVFQAGLLHDVGKVAISDGILLKPGALLPAEREVIQTHSTIGADLVSSVPSLRPIAPIILHHHERYDGNGYPMGLTAADIPLVSRIICAVDAYAAMTSVRPYRGALDVATVRSELQRTAGTQFDPDVVDALLRVLDSPEKRFDAWRDLSDDGLTLSDI